MVWKAHLEHTGLLKLEWLQYLAEILDWEEDGTELGTGIECNDLLRYAAMIPRAPAKGNSKSAAML